MKKRFFAFGCSYTNFNYLTWADYVGVNFDEYYNLGQGGASNTFIMNRVIEVDRYYDFDPETDTVYVMLSGIGRFSWLKNNKWETPGDLNGWIKHSKDDPNYLSVKSFTENLWNDDWAVHMSWIAAVAIKKLLSIKNIPHKLLMGLDNSHYIQHRNMLNLNSISADKAKDIYDMLSIKESLEEFRKTVEESDGHGHPSASMHLLYATKHFPELITDRSRSLINKPVYRSLIHNIL